MAFADYVAEIKGFIPDISPFFAQKCVNRAWQDIRDSDDSWSFLQGMSIIQISAAITAGTVSYTQYTNLVTCDATATTALAAVNNPSAQPPLVQTIVGGQSVIGTGRQIKIGAGPLYSIVAAAGSPLVLTVDRIISEVPSSSTIPYSVMRAYIAAPSTDFSSWTSITNATEGYVIRGPRLNGSQAQLNAVDPMRDSTQDPYFLFDLFTDSRGMPIKESWPTGVNQVGMIGMYRRRGTDLSATVDIPPSVPVNCLLERARYYAAAWKLTQPRGPQDTTNWLQVLEVQKRAYDEPVYGQLASAKKADSKLRTPLPIIRRGAGYYPWSSHFVASHDVNRLMGAFGSFFGYAGWY